MNGASYPDPTIKIVSPNLTLGGEVGFWTEEQFINTIRTGVTPRGYELNPDYMTWKNYRFMSDDELKAIFMYLKSLPKLEQYSE